MRSRAEARFGDKAQTRVARTVGTRNGNADTLEEFGGRYFVEHPFCILGFAHGCEHRAASACAVARGNANGLVYERHHGIDTMAVDRAVDVVEDCRVAPT